MRSIAILATLAIIVLAVLIAGSPVYVVSEMEQVILTRFGKPVGKPAIEAGMKFKLPFVDKVNRLEKRVLDWDDEPVAMATKDKTFILVETYGRWRISDPVRYFEALRRGDERAALSRLSDILGSETRNAIAKHELIETIRSNPTREAEFDSSPAGKFGSRLRSIKVGRAKIEQQIVEAAKPKLMDQWGIELLDVRFKRVNYNPEVLKQIQNRMISERQQIAERFRSEGQGEAASILGDKERELLRITSEAYRKEQEIRGAADATATEIYAKAYNQSKDSAEFYQFLKTLELYKSAIGKDSTLVLSTDSDLFDLLKGLDARERRVQVPLSVPTELPLFLRPN